MMEQIDQVNNMLRLKGEDQNTRVESNVLEPQSISDNYATFNIEKKGLLSPNSRLIIPLYAQGTGKANSRLSMYAGVYGIVRVATLRTGSGRVLAQTSRANYLMSMRNNWKDQDNRERRGQVVNGCYNVFGYTSESIQRSGQAMTFNGKYNVTTLNGGDQEIRYRLGQTDGNDNIQSDDNPQYSISLAELFPEMMPLTLPLFALNESVQLVLEFAPQVERRVSQSGAYAGAGDVKIDVNNVVFVSDHIYYSGDAMAKLQALTTTENGMVIAYGDFNTIDLQYTAPADPTNAGETATKSFVNSVGMAGLRVKYIMSHLHETENGANANEGQLIAGVYATSPDMAGADSVELQYQINNLNYYTEPLQNGEFYRELTDVFGVDASIPYPIYTCIGAVSDGKFGDTANDIGSQEDRRLITSATVFTNRPQSDLLASQQLVGINFTHNRVNNGMNGIEIGNSPVQITLKKVFAKGYVSNLENTLFACIQRFMSIKNGDIDTNFS